MIHHSVLKHFWPTICLLTVVIFCGTVLSCSVQKSLKSQKILTQQEKLEKEQSAFALSIALPARQVAEQNDLYASVMIAQAMLESASGKSSLSQAPYYNYFGIKGHYNGHSVKKWTWEDDGKGNPYEIQADFRSYGSMVAAFQDYADFLDFPNYKGVHRRYTKTYQDATRALTGTYATDTQYGAKLDYLIKKYGLTIYDRPLLNKQKSSSS